MKMTRNVVCLCTVLAAGAALAVPETAPSVWTLGGDLRLRQEMFDHIPIKADPPGDTRGGLNNYIRFRDRFFAQFDMNQYVGVYGRVVNEFREYNEPDTDSWNYPDEMLVDNLYLDLKKLLSDESLSFRIGRQDLFYGPGRPFGNGRLILEGTPKDGSRTIYFDAARMTWAPKNKLTVNVIGINNRSDAGLLLNSQDRDVTGYTSSDNDMDESGVVLYGTYEGIKDYVLESYYIFKHESDGETATAAGTVAMPDVDVSTAGFRVAGKHTEMLSSNLEMAGQLGDREGQDVEGYMVDAYVKGNFMNETAVKPWTKLGVTWYSGNDPDSEDDEGWNPVWGRYPQIGVADLLAYSYDADGAARWSNLTFAYAHGGISIPNQVVKDALLQLMVGQMSAPEADGPGGGHQRGLYAGSSIGGTLAKPGLTSKDSVKGHLVAEVLEPGDYYKSSQNMGYILRWELAYNF